MVILPSTYLGSIEYFAYLAQYGEECVVDVNEHYIKRSERNRAQIMTANGVMQLSVHVVNANRPRTPMHKVAIDYSKRWQHQHWVALLSAYRSSPYYDYVADRVASIYEREWGFLVDLNREILQAEFDILGLVPQHRFSDLYIEPQEAALDLRDKKRESTFCSPQYFQLFMDRTAFVENASMLDLLMCEGREAIDLLRGADLIVQP